MYPSRFRYEAPRSLDEAVALLRDGGDDAKVLAGGQSLVPLMKLRFASPELVVDINNLPGLDYHRADPDGTLHVGALCRHATLERSSLLAGTQPTMAAAAPLIADPIVRNRGTLVGSLCHADPQGDWASVVLALGGSVIAHGPAGRRAIPMAGFVTGPFQNTLDPAEIAVEAVIPAAAGFRTGGYLKLERRVGDFATVGVAVALDSGADGREVSDAPFKLQVAARPGALRRRHDGLDGDLVVLKDVLERAGHEVGERDRAPAAATLRDHRPAEREHHRRPVALRVGVAQRPDEGAPVTHERVGDEGRRRGHRRLRAFEHVGAL